MLNRLLHTFTYGLFGTPGAPERRPPVAVVEQGISEHLNPGAPFVEGEESNPVPRWPEHGAAMVAATPEDLLATQTGLVDKLRESSPLAPAKFDELIRPALLRYASWVHLLPASEQHHHFGPGGLLRHGLEVAVHAARMADGKQVGMDLVPAERNQYGPRWKVASMFGGLLHDIGKPLVDCGATDPHRTKTWPAQAGPLSEWLKEHDLTHYRIYWRSGARHERHKAIGTSVAREILGKDLLRYLSDEPTREVVDLMMLSIAQGRTSSNLMSQIVSKADSMSVEEDLRQLAKRTQSSAQGGSASNCSRIISELRDLAEAGKIAINRPGEPLWWTTEGLFAIYPRILDDVLPKLVAKQIPGIPASKAEIAQILVETGFLMPAEAETVDGKQSSATWDLTVSIESKGEPVATHKLRTIRFVEAALVVGNRPLPPPQKAEAKPPFVDIKTIDKNMEAVKVLGPDGGTNAADSPAPAGTPSPAAELAAPPTQEARAVAATPAEPQKPGSFMPSLEITGASGSTRNKRDMADATSVEKAISREKRGIPEQMSLEMLFERLNAAGMEGMAMAEVLDRITDARYAFQQEYTDTLDGLAIHYPDAFDGLGISPSDLMTALAHKGWLVIESGSDRKINERSFGDARRKCLILKGQPAKVWDAIKKEHPQVLSERPRKKVDRPAAPPPDAAPSANVPSPARPAEASTRARTTNDRREQQTATSARQTETKVQAPQRQGGRNGKAPPVQPNPEATRQNILSDAPKQNPVATPSSISVAAESLSDLTEDKVRAIKSAARMVLERDLFQLDIPLQDATTEQIREVLVRFAERNNLALAPMCSALLTSPSVIVADYPPMFDFHAIQEMALNPHFQLDPDDRKRVDQAIAAIRARRESEGAAS